jgi:hypothetical protein
MVKAFNDFKSFLMSLLSDSGPSSQRFNLLISTLLSNISVFGIWVIMCFKKGDMIDVPEGVYWLYGIANGVAGTMMALKRGADLKSKNCNENSSEIIIDNKKGSEEQ